MALVRINTTHLLNTALALALLVALPISVRAQEAATVTGVARLASEHAILDSVEALGVGIVRRDFGAGATDVEVLVKARAFPEPLVLWVDGQAHTIRVVRTEDGMALSRVLGQQTFTDEPYVAALAASELIELMQSTPATRVETKAVVLEPESPEAEPSKLSFSSMLGGELAASPRKGPALFRPLITADANYALNETLLLHGALVAMSYGVAVEPVPGGDVGSIRYRRSDVGLRLGAGTRRGDAEAIGYVTGGVGFLRVTPEGFDSDRARLRRRTQVTVGGGGVFRYFLWDRIGLAFGVDVAWLTSPARYFVDGALVLEEDSLRIGASLSLLVRIR